MVICLERSADLHMTQLLPLPLTVSCFSKIQIGFTFLVPAHPDSPGKRADKRVSVLISEVLMYHHHHHYCVACPMADVAVPTRMLQACWFCGRRIGGCQANDELYKVRLDRPEPGVTWSGRCTILVLRE